VQAALEALDSIDTVNVRRSPAEDAFGAFVYTITFTSDYNGGDVPSLVAYSAGLNGTGVVSACADGLNTGGCVGHGPNTVTGNQVGMQLLRPRRSLHRTALVDRLSHASCVIFRCLVYVIRMRVG
jgi:hypothetical protein